MLKSMHKVRRSHLQVLLTLVITLAGTVSVKGAEVEKSEAIIKLAPIDPALLIGLISIAIAIFFGLFFGLRGFRIEIGKKLEKLDKIEEHTKHISDIKDLITRLDEYVRNVLKLRQTGTISLQLKNLGKVEVTAEPGPDKVVYYITTSKPILISSFLDKKTKETEFMGKEKELFGRETLADVLTPTLLVWYVPSTDPKVCTTFISFLLKWLDTTYFESLEEIKEFEEPILKETSN